jgi:pyridoxal phosphate enzyme (YggS family)
MYADLLAERLPRTLDAIARAAESAGRDPAEVTLVAVTKGHPVEAVRAALGAGLLDLGENRVSELESKVEEMGSDSRVRWHMIGHLQSRKAPRVVGITHLVHSVDRASVAGRLGRAAEDDGGSVDVLIQVNTSGEEAKGGVPWERAEEETLALAETPGLRVRGLMTMAPFVEEEAVLRRTFRRLRELSETVRGHRPEVGGILSMGMTNDLELAVEEGSTMVRVGTALFGPRPGAGD